MKRVLFLISMLGLVTIVSASCSSSDSTGSLSEREYCQARALGSGQGAGLAATMKGKSFSDNNEILSYCISQWETESGRYYSAYKRTFVNGCLSNWGLSLRD